MLLTHNSGSVTLCVSDAASPQKQRHGDICDLVYGVCRGSRQLGALEQVFTWDTTTFGQHLTNEEMLKYVPRKSARWRRLSTNVKVMWCRTILNVHFSNLFNLVFHITTTCSSYSSSYCSHIDNCRAIWSETTFVVCHQCAFFGLCRLRIFPVWLIGQLQLSSWNKSIFFSSIIG